MTRHFLEIDDLTADELGNVLDLSEQPIDGLPKVLAGKGVAVLFEKPSARTRNSVEMAVVQLGGRDDPAHNLLESLTCHYRPPASYIAGGFVAYGLFGLSLLFCSSGSARRSEK